MILYASYILNHIGETSKMSKEVAVHQSGSEQPTKTVKMENLVVCVHRYGRD